MFTLSPAPAGLVGLVGALRRRPLAAPVVSPVTIGAARAVWAELRAEFGMRADGTARLLTPPAGNLKIAKNARASYSLTLSPAMSSGFVNTCVRTADCAAICVLTSGKGALSSVQTARDARTALLYRAPEAFAVLLADEIARAGRTHGAGEWAIRLNAASDVPWEIVAPWLVALVVENGGEAYDYTKAWRRSSTPGYRLTFSVDSRITRDEIASKITAGETVTVVVPVRKGAPMPATWDGMPAVDGDTTDDRSADAAGRIVLLRAKGKIAGARANGHPLVRSLV